MTKMHKKVSAVLFKQLRQRHDDLQTAGFAKTIRDIWRGLSFSDKKEAVANMHCLHGTVDHWREPLALVPDAFRVELYEQNILISVYEIEVCSFLTVEKAYRYFLLDEALRDSGVSIMLHLIDRYGQETVHEPEAVWMHLDYIERKARAA